MVSDGEDVLVAAAAHVHDDEMIARQGRRDLGDMRKRMRRLERRDDAFEPACQLERLQCLFVGYRDVLHVAKLVEPGMLGTDAGVIEAGGDRMRVADLSVPVLQQIGAVSVQYTRL